MSTAPLDESRRSRKSRIVIDIDKLPPGHSAGRRPAGRGRGRKVLLIIALVLFALVAALFIGGILWWQSFKKTPAYSLALLFDAATREDTREVERLIDSDQIAAGFVPQVTEKMTGGVALPDAARQQIEAATQTFLPRVRETMRDEIKAGMKEAAEKGPASRLPFPLLALGVRGAAEVKEEGDLATVKIKRGEQPVELTMKREGERWKVTSVKDDELASRIAERVRAALPAAPQNEQPPRQRPKKR